MTPYSTRPQDLSKPLGDHIRVPFASTSNPWTSAAADAANRLHGHPNSESPVHPPAYLDVVRLRLWCDNTVSHQEVNQDQAAIWLELAVV